MRRYELREDQWLKIAPLLPGNKGDPGRSADNRLFVHAVLWIARSGAPWRDLPERFGEWIGSPKRQYLSTLQSLGKERNMAKHI